MLRATYLAIERDEMVLAETEELDILDNDHLVVTFAEDCSINDVFNAVLVALGEGQQCLGVTRGCVEQSFAIRVFANTLEEGSYGATHLLQAGFGLFGILFSALTGSATYGPRCQ
jgi:hypothetical protein